MKIDITPPKMAVKIGTGGQIKHCRIGMSGLALLTWEKLVLTQVITKPKPRCFIMHTVSLGKKR